MHQQLIALGPPLDGPGLVSIRSLADERTAAKHVNEVVLTACCPVAGGQQPPGRQRLQRGAEADLPRQAASCLSNGGHCPSDVLTGAKKRGLFECRRHLAASWRQKLRVTAASSVN